MSNSFMGLNIAKSGLFANQRSLAVVSHNVANANTAGYSRQVLHTQAYKPHMLPGNKGSVGTGVEMNAIKQIRDEYLDRKMRSENSVKHEWEARASVFREMEGIFNEPSDASLASLMDNYYESLHTLSKNPENLTARALVRQNTIALTEGIRRTNSMLTTLQKDLNFKFKSAVTEVNAIADQIARVNEAIQKAEIEGGKANDLRDRRELLVDQLSELVDVDYYEDDQNRFFVLVGGHHIVSHMRADKIETVEREVKKHPYDAEDLVDIRWSNGNPINMKSGSMKGLLDARDSDGGASKGIPFYLQELDRFVEVFADEINKLHYEGYGLRDEFGNPHRQYLMFTVDDMLTADYLGAGFAAEADALADPNYDPSKHRIIMKKDALGVDQYHIALKITASNISIARDLEDPNKFAAAMDPQDVPGDGSNILRMVATRHNLSMFKEGAPEDFLKSLVSNLGVDAAEAYRVAANQGMLVREYQNLRDSVMGVSLDEEMAHMIKFQNAYNANARMINVFDEMLDLVVNRLGTVGR